MYCTPADSLYVSSENGKGGDAVKDAMGSVWVNIRVSMSSISSEIVEAAAIKRRLSAVQQVSYLYDLGPLHVYPVGFVISSVKQWPYAAGVRNQSGLCKSKTEGTPIWFSTSVGSWLLTASALPSVSSRRCHPSESIQSTRLLHTGSGAFKICRPIPSLDP